MAERAVISESAEEVQSFLDKYPNHKLIPLAEYRLAYLRARDTSDVSAVIGFLELQSSRRLTERARKEGKEGFEEQIRKDFLAQYTAKKSDSASCGELTTYSIESAGSFDFEGDIDWDLSLREWLTPLKLRKLSDTVATTSNVSFEIQAKGEHLWAHYSMPERTAIPSGGQISGKVNVFANGATTDYEFEGSYPPPDIIERWAYWEASPKSMLKFLRRTDSYYVGLARWIRETCGTDAFAVAYLSTIGISGQTYSTLNNWLASAPDAVIPHILEALVDGPSRDDRESLRGIGYCHAIKLSDYFWADDSSATMGMMQLARFRKLQFTPSSC